MRRSFLCALLVLALAGCGGHAAARKVKAPVARVKVTRAPVVMVLGDSYTAGIATMPPEKSYAAEAARRLGWQIIIGGYRGTGFVAPGRIGKTFATLYDEELAWRPAPDLVVVSGGHNDSSKSPALVVAAAQGLLAKIKQRWPDTPVVVLGPMWGGDPPPAALSVRDAVQSAAAATQVPFIDPLQEEWITGSVKLGTGNAPQYIRADGVHPTSAGCRYLGGRFVSALQRLGLATPSRA
ncbi:MAG: lipolytic protein family [Streptosporangiaceae bacterium]|nr:lipolytic protein family [Streptosporangiaceae bacterium]